MSVVKEFYISLPSNDQSKEIFPENDPAHWTTNLSPPVHCDGAGWEVALASITLPPSKRFDTSRGNFADIFDGINDTSTIIAADHWIFRTDTHRQTTILSKERFLTKRPFSTEWDIVRNLFLALDQEVGSQVGTNERLAENDVDPIVLYWDTQITPKSICLCPKKKFDSSYQSYHEKFRVRITKEIAERLKLVVKDEYDNLLPGPTVSAIPLISDDKRQHYPTNSKYRSGIAYNDLTEFYEFNLSDWRWYFEKSESNTTFKEKPTTLFVQSNVAESVRVGGRKFGVLREIQYNPSDGHQLIEIQNEAFYPVAQNRFDEIHIMLNKVSDQTKIDYRRNDNNYSTVKLHFRKIL